MSKLLEPVFAIDTEYDDKVPFIATMADDTSSKLFNLDIPAMNESLEDWWTVKKICEDPTITKVFHSATSDIYALSNLNIHVVPPYHCTFIMSSIIDENFISKKLKELAKRYLKEPCHESKILTKIKNKYKRLAKKQGIRFAWSQIPKEIIEPYAVKDAEYTIRIFRYFWDKIQPYYDLYQEELDLIPIIVGMEKRGHYIDRDYCRKEIPILNKLYEKHYNSITKQTGKLLNIGSPDAVQEIMIASGLYFSERTKPSKKYPKGRFKASKDIIGPFRKESPIINDLLCCRAAEKQENTYYDSLLNDYTTDRDPVAHFSFWQSGTKTGRFSAELIQTIPRKNEETEIPNHVRRAFIPRPGWVNLYFDYDQIEMRLFAHFTNNKSIIQRIIDGFDPHAGTAIDIFGQEAYDANPKETRRSAKTINFGIIYGMGIALLAKSLGLPQRKAQEILARYDQLYRVRKSINDITSLLYRQGFIRLDWCGREYRIPKDKAYKAMNCQIQGSAAYVIKKAIIRVVKEVIQDWPNTNLLLQIHDELVIETRLDNNHIQLAREIKPVMEDHTTFAVPLTTDCEYSEKSWLDKKPLLLGVK